VSYRVNKSPLPVSILTQIISVHTTSKYLTKIRLIIVRYQGGLRQLQDVIRIGTRIYSVKIAAMTNYDDWKHPRIGNFLNPLENSF
jgi:hypothetical protein